MLRPLVHPPCRTLPLLAYSPAHLLQVDLGKADIAERLGGGPLALVATAPSVTELLFADPTVVLLLLLTVTTLFTG